MTTSLIKFTDERTDVLGAGFTIDAEKFDALCGRAGLSPLTQVAVILVDHEEDGPPHGQFALEEGEEDVQSDKWRVAIPVLDSLDFSAKSVARVNRNLLHTLRHIAQVRNLVGFFGDEGGLVEGIMAFSGPVLEHDAYLIERSIKDQPENHCLTPEPVVLADDPVVVEQKDEA